MPKHREVASVFKLNEPDDKGKEKRKKKKGKAVVRVPCQASGCAVHGAVTVPTHKPFNISGVAERYLPSSMPAIVPLTKERIAKYI